MRLNLGEIFRFRDLAIDSSSKSGAPILHPELGAGGEWRFAYFRCENARLIVRATLQLIWELVASDKPKDAHVQKYVDVLRSRLDRLRNSNALKPDAAETGAHSPHVAQTHASVGRPASGPLLEVQLGDSSRSRRGRLDRKSPSSGVPVCPDRARSRLHSPRFGVR